MPVTLPDELRNPLQGVVAGELIGAPAVVAILFPAIAAHINPGTPTRVAEEALRVAEEQQDPRQGIGPLVDLGKELSRNGKSIGKKLLDWLATAGNGGAAGASPYDDIRVGGFMIPCLDHYKYRKHLRLACEGQRPAVWVPPPLGVDQRALHELVLHVGVHRRLRVGTAEWFEGIGMTPNRVVDKVARAFTAAKPDESTTTDTAYLAYLAGWLFDAAAAADRDGVFVFSGFKSPGADECLYMIAELVDLVSNTILANRRLRVVLLGCEFGPQLSAMVGRLPKTQEGALDATQQQQLKQDLHDLLRSFEDDGILDHNVANQIFDDIWSEPPDVLEMHGALEAIREE